jgi:hypothetical protein
MFITTGNIEEDLSKAKAEYDFEKINKLESIKYYIKVMSNNFSTNELYYDLVRRRMYIAWEDNSKAPTICNILDTLLKKEENVLILTTYKQNWLIDFIKTRLNIVSKPVVERNRFRGYIISKKI